jgi:hypothetical protein
VAVTVWRAEGVTRGRSGIGAIMTSMRSARFLHASFWGIGKASALLGRPGPLHWLTIAGRNPGSQRSLAVSLYQVDGRTYIVDLVPFRGWAIDVRPFRGQASDLRGTGWASDVRAASRGTLTTGRTDTGITLTEVTDPAVKRRVLTLSEDITGGLATAVPRSAVFEVTPAYPQHATARASRP